MQCASMPRQDKVRTQTWALKEKQGTNKETTAPLEEVAQEEAAGEASGVSSPFDRVCFLGCPWILGLVKKCSVWVSHPQRSKMETLAPHEPEIATTKAEADNLQGAKRISDEMVRDLDVRYSKMGLSGGRGGGDVEERLCELEEKIAAWDSDESMIWDRSPVEASQYLRVVDEIRQLTEVLEGSRSTDQDHLKQLHRAHSALQTANARLEDEFVHLLVQYQQPVEPERMSFRSTEDDSIEDFSCSSFDEEPVEGRIQADSSRGSEEFVIDLIHPHAVSELKCISEVMFLSSYDKECCQAYIGLRKDALEECLSLLRLEKLSIDEIVRMEWSFLNNKIKRWNRAMKVFIRVYLASEKRLCDLVFGDFSDSVRESCFFEISKGSILQLLNFGEAIAIAPLKPERLFRILDMYEGLSDLLFDLEALFPSEFGSSILTECHEVLLRLGEAVKGTFAEFKNAIRGNTSTTPFAGGRIHPLTKYVMNYVKALAAYGETLGSLFETHCFSEDDDDDNRASHSPVVRQLHSVVSLLETNLEARSMLYNENALQSFFMMNNICYMAQKAKDADLRTFLGDEWIRSHNWKFQQHALSYERASWSAVLSFLKDEGICNPGSNTPSRTILKERFKGFNAAFEEVYRAQTAWLITDLQLREDLKISISLRVLQAYRTFMGKYSTHLDSVRHRDRYIKYWPDDLEKCLLDLFEGCPRVLHFNSKR